MQIAAQDLIEEPAMRLDHVETRLLQAQDMNLLTRGPPASPSPVERCFKIATRAPGFTAQPSGRHGGAASCFYSRMRHNSPIIIWLTNQAVYIEFFGVAKSFITIGSKASKVMLS